MRERLQAADVLLARLGLKLALALLLHAPLGQKLLLLLVLQLLLLLLLLKLLLLESHLPLVLLVLVLLLLEGGRGGWLPLHVRVLLGWRRELWPPYRRLELGSEVMQLLSHQGLLADIEAGSRLAKSAGELVLEGLQTDEGPVDQLLLLLLGQKLLLRLLQEAPLALALLVEFIALLNELLDLSKAVAQGCLRLNGRALRWSRSPNKPLLRPWVEGGECGGGRREREGVRSWRSKDERRRWLRRRRVWHHDLFLRRRNIVYLAHYLHWSLRVGRGHEGVLRDLLHPRVLGHWRRRAGLRLCEEETALLLKGLQNTLRVRTLGFLRLLHALYHPVDALYLSERPPRDAVIPAEPLEHRCADAELERNLFHGEVEVIRQELKIDVCCLAHGCCGQGRVLLLQAIAAGGRR